MKKAYTAPRVYLEHFELTEHIAACGDTSKNEGNELGWPTHYDAESCQFKLTNGKTMFITEVNCDIPTDPTKLEGACYNTPTGGVSIFAS